MVQDFEQTMSCGEKDLRPYVIVITDKARRSTEGRRNLYDKWLVEKLRRSHISNSMQWCGWTLLQLATVYRCVRVAAYLMCLPGAESSLERFPIQNFVYYLEKQGTQDLLFKKNFAVVNE